MKNYFRINTLTGILALFLVFSLNAMAENTDLHTTSETYQVYLGIVPGARITKEPYLVDRDKSLHGGIDSLGSNDYHVMVAIFDKENNSRIKDATVIAKIDKKGFMSGENITMPMEKMITSGTVSYGNFFNLKSDSTYNMTVEIYRPRSNGYEEVEFTFKPF
ncbi:hypothetical protein [Thiohalophilus thiocyanatoxydans]|uniref:DUF4426 domain-containing protein n=1 Tax=Thiohalophilus thiocyanatoxydans TaxID=381308 RepID=A0A4R8INI5_9GAMM|nr:hypothetical protein [Thiohalophilus thiocyanatoxydans]TDY02441.1 hypothetical protein EDC23_0811 [Thiohalophilus thiocyanatoxydans]